MRTKLVLSPRQNISPMWYIYWNWTKDCRKYRQYTRPFMYSFLHNLCHVSKYEITFTSRWLKCFVGNSFVLFFQMIADPLPVCFEIYILIWSLFYLRLHKKPLFLVNSWLWEEHWRMVGVWILNHKILQVDQVVRTRCLYPASILKSTNLILAPWQEVNQRASSSPVELG